MYGTLTGILKLLTRLDNLEQNENTKENNFPADKP